MSNYEQKLVITTKAQGAAMKIELKESYYFFLRGICVLTRNLKCNCDFAFIFLTL